MVKIYNITLTLEYKNHVLGNHLISQYLFMSLLPVTLALWSCTVAQMEAKESVIRYVINCTECYSYLGETLTFEFVFSDVPSVSVP